MSDDEAGELVGLAIVLALAAAAGMVTGLVLRALRGHGVANSRGAAPARAATS